MTGLASSTPPTRVASAAACPGAADPLIAPCPGGTGWRSCSGRTSSGCNRASAMPAAAARAAARVVRHGTL